MAKLQNLTPQLRLSSDYESLKFGCVVAHWFVKLKRNNRLARNRHSSFGNNFLCSKKIDIPSPGIQTCADQGAPLWVIVFFSVMLDINMLVTELFSLLICFKLLVVRF